MTKLKIHISQNWTLEGRQMMLLLWSYTHVYMFIHMYVYMFIHIHMYVYLFTNIPNTSVLIYKTFYNKSLKVLWMHFLKCTIIYSYKQCVHFFIPLLATLCLLWIYLTLSKCSEDIQNYLAPTWTQQQSLSRPTCYVLLLNIYTHISVKQ